MSESEPLVESTDKPDPACRPAVKISQAFVDEEISIAEAGSIGEEQLPSAAGAGRKTDKHVWNYAADNLGYVSAFGQWFYQTFKGQ